MRVMKSPNQDTKINMAAGSHEIRHLYVNTNLPLSEIARRHNISRGTLATAAQRAGWPRRCEAGRPGTPKFHIIKGADEPIRRVKKCQFPLWDNELPPIHEIDNHYCGAVAAEGSSYCEKHHRICHNRSEGLRHISEVLPAVIKAIGKGRG